MAAVTMVKGVKLRIRRTAARRHWQCHGHGGLLRVGGRGLRWRQSRVEVALPGMN
jgi:hypothetical protein